MKKLCCIFFFVWTVSQPLGLIAQRESASVSGIITTADGSPLAFATIELKKTKRATHADGNGYFSILHLPPIEDSLFITYGSNQIYSVEISLREGLSLHLGNLRTNSNVRLLEDVEIMGQQANSYKSSYSFFGTKTQSETKDIPQSVSVVTKELIQDKMEFTLKDAVGDVAGVNQYSGYDEYTIRGFRAENARDINGLRGYNTTYTSTMLVNIERVEVIKGPTATLYGNCDPGGTINLVTKKPLDHAEGGLNIFGGSWDHFKAAGDITGAMNKNKTLLYRLNAGYDQTNSWRDQIHGSSYQVAPSLTFLPNNKIKINLDFSISHINTVLDRGQPGLDDDNNLFATPVKLSISQPGNYLKETDIASILSFSYKISNRLSFNMGYLNYITQQNVAEHGFNDYITPDSISLYYSTWNYHTATNTLTNYFTYLTNTGNISHKLLLGYDYVNSKVELNQQYFELPDQFGVGSGIVGTFALRNPHYNQQPVSSYQLSDFNSDASDVDGEMYHTQGVYMQDELNYRRWKVLLSLREEFYKGDGEDSASSLSENVFLPRIGIVYALTNNINLYATYNRGFDPFEVSTEAQVFDAPFKPIISELYEAGAKGNFFHSKLAASLAFYNLIVDNVAVNAGDPSDPNLFVQQGQNKSMGIEAEAVGNILPNFSIMISYAYDLATVTQSKDPSQIGTRVANAPLNSSASWFKYSFNNRIIKGFGVSIGYSFVGKRNTLEPGITLPSYFLLNGGINYGYKQLNLAVIVNNITNQTYWMGAYNNINKWPGAPIHFMVNMGFKF